MCSLAFMPLCCIQGDPHWHKKSKKKKKENFVYYIWVFLLTDSKICKNNNKKRGVSLAFKTRCQLMSSFFFCSGAGSLLTPKKKNLTGWKSWTSVFWTIKPGTEPRLLRLTVSSRTPAAGTWERAFCDSVTKLTHRFKSNSYSVGEACDWLPLL